MVEILKRTIQGVLHNLGYQLVATTRPKPQVGFSHSDGKVPSAYVHCLKNDNPRLQDLRQRYRKSTLPMAMHTWWDDTYISENLDLQHFRGDNAYVWQTRQMGESVVQRYYLYLRDVRDRDGLGLLGRLSEEGAFGSWVYRFHCHRGVSRDLLDAVNEINFLERHAGISGIRDLQILDIGAGYGRMAHRCCEALPNLKEYFCTDAVAESTFLSEIYLDYRQCLGKARVVPLDELEQLKGKSIDLAVNVHSFSEMSLSAIEGWLDILVGLNISNLFVVPNDPEAFLSMEANDSRLDFLPLLERKGFRIIAKEPVIKDDDIRELVGVNDHMFLFGRC